MSAVNPTRREALIKLAWLIGAGAIVPRLLAGSGSDTAIPTAGFTPEEIALLDEIGETIIPATDIAGAKSVGIGAFIAMMVTDCYRDDDHGRFHAGIAELARGYRERYHEDFVGGPSEHRTAYLNELDTLHRKGAGHASGYAAKPHTGDDSPMPHYYKVLKDFTVLGYFSSEVGCTQAVRFVEVPGRYDPDVPYHKGDRAWFSA